MSAIPKRVVPLAALTVLAAAFGLPARAFSAEPTSSAASVRPAAFAPALPHDAVRVGSLAPDQPVAFAVTLAPSHPAELASLMRALYDPASPRYRQWLAPGEYARRFGPDPAQVRAVMHWLHGVGLDDARLVDGHIEVSAPARTTANALGVSFARYRAADGTTTFASNAAPLVPRFLARDITAIVGLSDAARLQPRHTVLTAPGAIRPALTAHAQSCTASITNQANGLGGWTTRQVGAKYQLGPVLKAGLNGTGKTIAIYELAPHTKSDTAAYLSCFGLHNAITTRAVDGGSPDTNSGGVVEANLDIEAAAAIAPGAKIISYEGPNTSLGSVHVWSAIINEDKAQSVSTSWGICEKLESASERKALHALLTQAAAQGQSIFAATGDAGSEDCLFSTGDETLAVDSPADEPLVTGVGGTSLQPGIAVTKPAHEPVWNDCAGAIGFLCSDQGGGAGGGGLSKLYAKPSWQPAAGESTCSPGCRQVPDIAANAGIGEAFYSAGAWSLVRGTSIASPKLAGMAADITKGCVSSLGPFNRKVYALSISGDLYGSGLRDVPAAQGDNDLTRNNAGHFSSANGYDLATGMGTPLVTGLVCPEVMHVSAATAKAGTRVKITGLGLARATIRFGNTAARVVSRTSTAATVIVPKGSGTVQIRGSGVMGKGTLHATFRYRAG